MSISGLKRTTLYGLHQASGAKCVPFAGYEMPVQYAGIKAEHEAVRKAAGLFDVSHMGNAWITGPGAWDFIQKISTADLGRIEDGGVQYSAMATPAGNAVDDILIYRLRRDRYMVVLNAANAAKDMAWMTSHLPSSGVELADEGDATAILSLQGPRSQEILQSLTAYPLGEMAYYRCAVIPVLGREVLVSRTGYTGEDGFELFPPAAEAPRFWERLLEMGHSLGLRPCGLGARDTLRLEAGFSLYGHEITEETNLLEAGLGWIVALDKPDFIGKSALAAAKSGRLSRKLVGLAMKEQGIPREGCTVAHEGVNLGRVTSGTMSPTLGHGIALALISAEHAKTGILLDILVRDQPKKAEVVSRYFYRRRPPAA